jgi:hypothetical protein
MTLEVHIDWLGQPHLVGRLHGAEQSSSISFEYDTGWLRHVASASTRRSSCQDALRSISGLWA